MTEWTDEEIIAKIRAYADSKQLPPPAPVEAVAELEAAVGHPMPSLLRRLYCEVANGGFGVDGDVVSLTDNGRWFSDEESLIKIHQEWSTPQEQLDLYPNHILPLATMGCAIWWCIDLSTPEGRMWGWDPNSLCERHRLFPEKFTFAEWLADWLQGHRTFPDVPDMPDCPDC
ncbi:SMI1/KNR4 family protein [Streptacidiphilus neutrinimicus]|uniref:SMI1/KNR4 family protein n=1 Tax=Streptacidiphilus neutrinimicus TaxID=105420 RepID=UPI0007C757F6|nr:SMI1/KNR4 family protein [Streptacidiphilus neutrinimicus]